MDHVAIPKIRGNTVLDVGCGFGKWGFLAKQYFWCTQNGSMVQEPLVAGIDLHYANVQRLNQQQIYDIVIHGSATHLPFQDKSFDTVLAFELLEHLTEADGYQALREFERVARQCILLSTPNKKCLRDGLECVTGFNPHEAHLSWWQIKDFQALGYRCYGLGMKLPPAWLWNAVEFSYLSYRLPVISDTLFCVKLLTQTFQGNGK